MLGQVLPLALLDTVSVSTLAIPLWFLLAPRGLRFANVYLYLLLVGAGYLLLGIALMGGLSVSRQEVRSALESRAGDIAVAAVGIALILFAAWYGLLRKNSGAEGRLNRWREAAVGESATLRGVVMVAAIAVTLEIATMFPYLMAIDTLGRTNHPWITRVLILALYCLVMVAPAGIVTLGRMLLGEALTPMLDRVNDWIRRNEREDTAWLLAIAGVVLLVNTRFFDQLMALLGKR
ncbi:GAP family protein [Micromonospora sp. NPDC049679]|uniref:GAP family protein n=1 Tax=Micromonospora sp. NPDC049679 TaxID=3155920 RepID=UPI0033FAABF8